MYEAIIANNASGPNTIQRAATLDDVGLGQASLESCCISARISGAFKGATVGRIKLSPAAVRASHKGQDVVGPDRRISKTA